MTGGAENSLDPSPLLRARSAARLRWRLADLRGPSWLGGSPFVRDLGPRWHGEGAAPAAPTRGFSAAPLDTTLVLGSVTAEEGPQAEPHDWSSTAHSRTTQLPPARRRAVPNTEDGQAQGGQEEDRRALPPKTPEGRGRVATEEATETRGRRTRQVVQGIDPPIARVASEARTGAVREVKAAARSKDGPAAVALHAHGLGRLLHRISARPPAAGGRTAATWLASLAVIAEGVRIAGRMVGTSIPGPVKKVAARGTVQRAVVALPTPTKAPEPEDEEEIWRPRALLGDPAGEEDAAGEGMAEPNRRGPTATKATQTPATRPRAQALSGLTAVPAIHALRPPSPAQAIPPTEVDPAEPGPMRVARTGDLAPPADDRVGTPVHREPDDPSLAVTDTARADGRTSEPNPWPGARTSPAEVEETDLPTAVLEDDGRAPGEASGRTERPQRSVPDGEAALGGAPLGVPALSAMDQDASWWEDDPVGDSWRPQRPRAWTPTPLFHHQAIRPFELNPKDGAVLLAGAGPDELPPTVGPTFPSRSPQPRTPATGATLSPPYRRTLVVPARRLAAPALPDTDFGPRRPQTPPSLGGTQPPSLVAVPHTESSEPSAPGPRPALRPPASIGVGPSQRAVSAPSLRRPVPPAPTVGNEGPSEPRPRVPQAPPPFGGAQAPLLVSVPHTESSEPSALGPRPALRAATPTDTDRHLPTLPPTPKESRPAISHPGTPELSPRTPRAAPPFGGAQPPVLLVVPQVKPTDLPARTGSGPPHRIVSSPSLRRPTSPVRPQPSTSPIPRSTSAPAARRPLPPTEDPADPQGLGESETPERKQDLRGSVSSVGRVPSVVVPARALVLAPRGESGSFGGAPEQALSRSTRRGGPLRSMWERSPLRKHEAEGAPTLDSPGPLLRGPPRTELHPELPPVPREVQLPGSPAAVLVGRTIPDAPPIAPVPNTRRGGKPPPTPSAPPPPRRRERRPAGQAGPSVTSRLRAVVSSLLARSRGKDDPKGGRPLPHPASGIKASDWARLDEAVAEATSAPTPPKPAHTRPPGTRPRSDAMAWGPGGFQTDDASVDGNRQALLQQYAETLGWAQGAGSTPEPPSKPTRPKKTLGAPRQVQDRPRSARSAKQAWLAAHAAAMGWLAQVPGRSKVAPSGGEPATRKRGGTVSGGSLVPAELQAREALLRDAAVFVGTLSADLGSVNRRLTLDAELQEAGLTWEDVARWTEENPESYERLLHDSEDDAADSDPELPLDGPPEPGEIDPTELPAELQEMLAALGPDFYPAFQDPDDSASAIVFRSRSQAEETVVAQGLDDGREPDDDEGSSPESTAPGPRTRPRSTARFGGPPPGRSWTARSPRTGPHLPKPGRDVEGETSPLPPDPTPAPAPPRPARPDLGRLQEEEIMAILASLLSREPRARAIIDELANEVEDRRRDRTLREY